MTNPSQLQYLEAIGIPVWVSRDLVITKQAEQPLQAQQQHSQTKVEGGADSMESILQGLETNTKPVSASVGNGSQASVQAPEVVARTEYTPSPLFSSQATATTTTANEIGRTNSHIIYGCGSLQADWMVIGESPDVHNDRNNQPFPNEAGVLLSNMLHAVGLENPRENAYLINVIASSMQAKVDEKSYAELNQLLLSKIKEVKPKMVLLVGQLAAQNVLQSKEPLARLRAKPQLNSDTNTNMVVTYYPTYLLSKPMDKRKAWDDLKLAMKILNASTT
ncbi:MAG: uracil-DNA glycosylase [Cocleimonas sp.]